MTVLTLETVAGTWRVKVSFHRLVAKMVFPVCLHRAQNTMQKGLEDFKKRRACSKLGKKCIYQQLVEGKKIRR